MPANKKYPLLRCPKCGYEYRPTMHGWAFKTDAKTPCAGRSAEDSFRHPFKVVEQEGNK